MYLLYVGHILNLLAQVDQRTRTARLGVIWWLILAAIVALIIGVGGWGTGWWGHHRGPRPPAPPGPGMPPRKGGLPPTP